jgi:hypothetical protein
MSSKDTALKIFISDSVLVSEAIVVGIIYERLTTWKVSGKSETVVSVAEYRKLLGDQISSDERITERLMFLEAFCRNVIRPELEIYGNKKHRSP